MRKVLMGAAVMAMFATGCQNEVIVNGVQSADKGEFFTLEVGKGFGSRTVLSGTATHWCEDDAIFVSGANGKVSGVLTFESYVGDDKSQAKFSGWISGGQPSELEHIVFPVPQGGKIDMAKRDPNKLDAPMIGTIGNGTVQTLKNVGGLVTFDTKGEVYDVEAISGTNNMSGGSYTFDPQAGTLTYVPGSDLVPTYVDEGGNAYVPVATTINPTNGTSTETLSDVTINMVKDKQIIASAEVNVTSGEIFGDGDGEDTGALDIKEVKTIEELEAALGIGGYIKLANDIELDDDMTVENEQTVLIDLDNNALIGEYESICQINGKLTLMNGRMVSTATAVWTKGGELNLIGMNIKSESVDKSTIVAVEGNGTIAKILDGSYTSESEPGDGIKRDWYAIAVKNGAEAELNTTVSGKYNGGVTVHGAKVNFTGGSYSGDLYYGLYMYGNAEVTYNTEEVSFKGKNINVYADGENIKVNGNTVKKGEVE